MLQLSASRLNKLQQLVQAGLESAAWPEIREGQQERSITHHYVGPVVKSVLETVGERQLILRHDGAIAPRSILRYGMSFSPDLEISLYSQKCLAVEVKILRDHDASGSLTKAVGQTFMYKALGFDKVIGLIFDVRKNTKLGLRETLNQLTEDSPDVSFTLIK